MRFIFAKDIHSSLLYIFVHKKNVICQREVCLPDDDEDLQQKD